MIIFPYLNKNNLFHNTATTISYFTDHEYCRYFVIMFLKRVLRNKKQTNFIVKGGGRMCHFLKLLKLTHELSQKMSYSSELWYGSCFYDIY